MGMATLTKWGNGQGVLIPKNMCELLGLKTGDKVSITAVQEKIIIERPEEKYTFEARLRNWDGKGQPVRDYDWGKPVGKEMW